MKAVDLFSGVGGLAKGFGLAGHEILASYDNWPEANEVCRRNLSHPVYELDLSDAPRAAEHVASFRPELIVGGPPCQDFSSAGKRRERGNAFLTIAFSTIVRKLRPQCFVMENVARAVRSSAYARARKQLKSAGYGLTEVVLDASYCGVPQIRKRFFCLGGLDAPNGKWTESLQDRQEKVRLSVAEYIGGEIGTELYYRHPRNYSRRAIYSVHEPSATIRGVNRPIPPNYPGHPRDAGPVSAARALTTVERAHIQTFPREWSWVGTKSQVEQMLGNAVPVKLAEFVGKALLEVK